MHIKGLTKLQKLNLFLCPKITDAGVAVRTVRSTTSPSCRRCGSGPWPHACLRQAILAIVRAGRVRGSECQYSIFNYFARHAERHPSYRALKQC